MKPTTSNVHRKPTTTTASGFTGALLVHQPVLRTQVYTEE